VTLGLDERNVRTRLQNQSPAVPGSYSLFGFVLRRTVRTTVLLFSGVRRSSCCGF